jgi:hypothetical protein
MHIALQNLRFKIWSFQNKIAEKRPDLVRKLFGTYFKERRIKMGLIQEDIAKKLTLVRDGTGRSKRTNGAPVLSPSTLFALFYM